VNRNERAVAESWLKAAWGSAVGMAVDKDGDLRFTVELPDGRVSGTVASLDSPLLRWLTLGAELAIPQQEQAPAGLLLAVPAPPQLLPARGLAPDHPGINHRKGRKS
jgi:hypothetical protein